MQHLAGAQQPDREVPPHPLRRALRVARSLLIVSGGPVALFTASAVAPVAVLRGWSGRPHRTLLRRATRVATSAGLAFPALYLLWLRPWLKDWGSTAQERATRYPGDHRPGRRPLSTSTRAVTVEAPAAHVWKWIAQIGSERAGFYSYDVLENLAGCRLRSADRIHPEWQDVRAGDPIGMTPELGTEVEIVEPGHALVIRHWGAYIVEPVDAQRSRVIARSHVDRGAGALFYYLAFELPHAIMERRMLLGIKERAEQAAWTG